MPRARSPDVKLASIFDLATSLPLPHQKFGSMELEKMFEIALIEASCIQPELLEAKYGAPGVQSVVSITNKATLEQVHPILV